MRKKGGGYLSKELQEGFHKLFGSKEFINAMGSNLSARSSSKRGMTKRTSRSALGSGTRRPRSKPLDLNVRLLPPPRLTATGCTIYPVPVRVIRSRQPPAMPLRSGLKDKREGYLRYTRRTVVDDTPPIYYTHDYLRRPWGVFVISSEMPGSVPVLPG